MAVSLNINVASLNALRRLDQSTQKLAGTQSHLSSGLRITRPSDDAAGLSVGTSLRADARVLAQGVRNINDGVSLLNIAEGALGQLSNIVIRQKELAEQAANGVYSGRQRQALQTEANALVREYNRIIRSTTFNNQNIIDGISDSFRLQQGYGINDSTMLTLSQQLGFAAGSGSLIGASQSINGAYGAAIGDLDGDGINDMVSALGDTISVLFNNGSGETGDNVLISSITMTNNPDLQIADMNNDGRPDIMLLDRTTNRFYVQLNLGNRTFADPVGYYTSTNGAATAQHYAVSDFNGDGSLDIAVSNSWAGGAAVGILLGNGNGTFKAPTTMMFGTATSLSSINAADFNGDGVADLAVNSQTNSEPTKIFLGNGNGTFLAPYVVGGTGRINFGVAADINGDGNMDLVLQDFGSATLAYVLGNGDGSFKAKTVLSGYGFAAVDEVRVADMNGDGHLDIVANDTGEWSFITFLGNGDGSFRAAISYEGQISNGFVLGDLNQDGITDLLTSDFMSAYMGMAFGVADTTGRRNSFAYDYDFLTTQSARQGLVTATNLLTRISREIGAVGALQSRLTSSLSNIQNRASGYSEASARILDADIAEEVAIMTRTSILQRASSAVLAQANQQPKIALKLLDIKSANAKPEI